MADRLPRKLATILYADVAGYSRLTGEDEEGTHRTLRTYLDLLSSSVREHDGRVVHYAGDAVLADFGTAVDALTCVERAAALFASFATAQVRFLLETLRDAGLPAERAEQAGNS
jgi:class 3 adenylate cyclase